MGCDRSVRVADDNLIYYALDGARRTLGCLQPVTATVTPLDGEDDGCPEGEWPCGQCVAVWRIPLSQQRRRPQRCPP